MARVKVKTVELYQFSNYSIAQIIEKYLDMYGKSHVISLHHKITFLTHLIIASARTNKDNIVHLHSERLKCVIGESYGRIISCLQTLKLIDMSKEYVVGEHCRDISVVDWHLCKITSRNVQVMAYLDEWTRLLRQSKEKYDVYLDVLRIISPNHRILKKNIEKSLLDNYNDSLSLLKLKDDKSIVQNYIEEKFTDKDSHRYNYYFECIDSFLSSKPAVISVDNSHRIYHCLTNMPKDLKRFFNLKFQIDIANSHPLIFSYFLIEELKISIDILKVIYNINIKREEYMGDCHIVADIIRKELTSNNIMYQGEMDILVYIYIVSKGWLWDDFQAISGMDREDVKKKCFTEIFYHPKNIAEHTEFGRAFIKRYPTVYGVIAGIKYDQMNLAKMLMSKESELMQKVLRAGYARGLKLINIHDAVLVLDVPENSKLTPDDVRHAINEIFRKQLLHPSTHVDVYAE